MLTRRSLDTRTSWSNHPSIGAETFTPLQSCSLLLSSDCLEPTALCLIRVGNQPWQRLRCPIVVERGIAPIPVYILSLSWRGVNRASYTVSSRQISLRGEETTVRLSNSHQLPLTRAAVRCRKFLTQLTAANVTIASLVLSRSTRIQVKTPRVKLSPRELPSPSPRFRRRVFLSPFSLTTGDQDV